MNKIILLFIFIFIFSTEVFSNDSGIIAIGGSWVVMKNEHPSIQMEREKIDINVYKEYYDVIVEFIFVNKGPECSTYMGFPESGFGDMGTYIDTASAFIIFSTTVNGITVEARREKVLDESSDMEYKAFWVKEVSFKEGETKKIVVKYRSPLGSRVSDFYNGSDNFIRYTFSGGNWQGKVLESMLDIYFHIPVEIRPSKEFALKKVLNHYIYYRTNWEAEEYFGVTFKIK